MTGAPHPRMSKAIVRHDTFAGRGECSLRDWTMQSVHDTVVPVGLERTWHFLAPSSIDKILRAPALILRISTQHK